MHDTTTMMLATLLLAAALTLHVSPNRLASAGIDVPIVESNLAVDPADPKHLVGVAIVGDDFPATTCATFLSRDGGETWSGKRLKVTQCGDPWALVGPKQTIVTVLAGSPELGVDDGLLVFRSADGGATWPTPPHDLGSYHDHDTLFADLRDPAKPKLFVLASFAHRVDGHLRGAISLARSDDWVAFPRITRITPSNLNMNTMGGVVLRDGTVAVAYIDYARWIRGPEAFLERPRVWMVLSRDGGESFGAPMLITEGCGKQWPAPAADPADDTLYLTCMVDDFHRIVLHRSRDRGETWSVLPVHAAPAGTTVNSANVAVGKNGTLLVTWQSETDAAKHCNALFAAASADGGATFSEPARVSEGTSCNATERNAKMLKRWEWGGDYYGLAADRDGVFHVIWSDSRNGAYQLWSASIRAQPSH